MVGGSQPQQHIVGNTLFDGSFHWYLLGNVLYQLVLFVKYYTIGY